MTEKRKKRSAISNTSRTLKYLRTQGWVCGMVERFNPYAGPYGIRQDLFGFIDIIALAEKSVIGVQSCGQNFSEHKKKILENEYAPVWLESSGRILLIGWRKIKLHRGGKALRWAPRIEEITLKDFS